jgi:hypothetical protein
MEKLIIRGIVIVCCTVIIAIALSLFMYAKSDGKVDYCYILYNNDSTIHLPSYVIMGHRSWRIDIRMAIASSVDEANAKRQILCP